jgi:8-oxo-dGTP diphosphatase
MTNNKQQYVLGFMFNEDKSKVALIFKTKPENQVGLMNGIGGKIENNETPYQAMVREFREETGYDTSSLSWELYSKLDGERFEVFVYTVVGDLTKLKTTTEEKIIIVEVKDIHTFQYKLLTNVPWLIEMAIDFLNNKQFDMATIRY